MDLYVQYGCGLCAPESWLNFDNSLSLNIRRLPVLGRALANRLTQWPENVEYGDIVKGLRIPLGAYQAIYASHVLEHLTLSEVRIALRRTNDYLIHNGRFRLVVPDLRRLAESYVQNGDCDAAHVFMRNSRLGTEARNRGFKGLIRSAMGESGHLSMWDFDSMRSELVRAGFVDIRRASFGDSDIAAYQEVEEEGRWFETLGIECIKRG